MRTVILGVLTATVCFGLCLSTNAEPITTGTLIEEMVDLRRLPEFPEPCYKTVQFSSYDHRSSLPGGPDWFANADGFGNEPLPNFEGVLKAPDDKGVGEYLVCDVAGPGAIVRVWTARMGGTIQMFLDGAEEPVFDGSASDFLIRPYHAYVEEAGIDEDILFGTLYQRNAAYCPMPFAQRCRIVWRGNLAWTHFYQIQIRLYGKSAEVVTFSPKALRKHKKAIRRVAKVLVDPDHEWEYASREQPIAFTVAVPPGADEKALELEGPKAIERLSLSVKADDLDKALRQTVLHILCDRYPWGQVQAPIGDFFGAAPGINPFTSVPFTVAADGTMTCRYVMPFAESLKIEIENRGAQPVEVSGSVLPMGYEWHPERSMHFRARWRVDHDAESAGSAVKDMPYLIANGSGVYVGTATMLLNPNPIPTSGGNWWGEGDEKIFVDDDVRPSTFGTGSEDYFNYAWSSTDIFGFPYCGQPRNDGPANRGFVTNHRWHILDPLPFKQRLSFYMELFCHVPTKGFSYARIGFHYGRPGLMDDHVAITDEDVRPPELPENWEPLALAGARNSVFYEAEDTIEAKDNIRLAQDNLWSGGALCRWTPKAAGEELTLTIAIGESGEYTLRLGLAHDAQSGAVSMRVDGEDAGFGGEARVADLYVPYRTLCRNVATRQVKLDQGDHTLTLRFEGGREDVADKSIGIDYIWVQKR